MKKNLFLIKLLCLFICTSIKAQVINNFEGASSSVSSALFRNENSVSFSILDCDISPVFGNVIAPVFSSFNMPTQKASIVTAVSEPILLSYGYNVNCVGSNGGNYALRLNDVVSGQQDITAFEQVFVAMDEFLSFDYLGVLDSNHVNNLNIQPFFTARLLDINNNIIPSTEFCLIADPNEPLLVNVNSHIFFTKDWYCGLIKIPEEYLGQQLKIQFVVADCGAGAHRGVVYLDNIINKKTCETPTYGYISLDYLKLECPTEPFKVCGTYAAPSGATLNNMILEIISNGNVVYQVLIPSYNNGNEFCFEVDFNNFNIPLSGDFEFRVVADFQAANGYIYTLEDESTAEGPDVFCCEVYEGPIDFWDDGDYLNWTDFTPCSEYIIEVVADGTCCPEDQQSVPSVIHTISVENNYINMWDFIGTVGDKCLRWRIKTPSGWTEWCCVTSYPGSPGTPLGNNYNVPCIEEFNVGGQSLIVSPNPTTELITLNNFQGDEFVIYDFKQNIVKKIKVKDNKEELIIDLRELESGIYILKSNSDKEVKIIKK